MNPRRCFGAAILGVSGLMGCFSQSAVLTGPHGRPEQERSSRLENLGLLYDDTIITKSARTVDFNGQALVPRHIYTDLDEGDRELRVHLARTGVVFGLHTDVTTSLTVPYVFKRLERTNSTTGKREILRSDGVADIGLSGKYRFFQNTGAGETTEAAAIFGLELPTGRTDVKDGGMRLPQPLQPGSGSVDAVLGAVFTRVDGRWLLNADLLAKINSEADDYRFGNVYRFDVGGQFRLYPARYERFDQPTVNLVAEVNAAYAGRDTFQGISVFDSGGLEVFATPGLQVIVSESLLFEVAVQLPLFLGLHGSQLEENFRTIIGLRARF